MKHSGNWCRNHAIRSKSVKKQVLADLEWNRLAHDREYAFVLHSAQSLAQINDWFGLRAEFLSISLKG